MTTTTNIHVGSAPPAQLAPQGADSTAEGFPAHVLDTTRRGAPPAEGVGGSSARWSRERERPEDDEAVITPVLPAVSHRSFQERPEDDEVIITYTSEFACRPGR